MKFELEKKQDKEIEQTSGYLRLSTIAKHRRIWDTFKKFTLKKSLLHRVLRIKKN